MAGHSRAQALPDIYNAVAGFFLETPAPVNRVAKQPLGVMAESHFSEQQY